MNPQKIFLKITRIFGKKQYYGKRAVALEKIWKSEIVLAAVLLSCFLAFDFWLYQNFVLRPPDLSIDKENIVPFKKFTIERTVKKIDSYADFLEHPSFQFVQSPF